MLYPMALFVINHKAILLLNVLMWVDFPSSIEEFTSKIKLKLDQLTKYLALSILSTSVSSLLKVSMLTGCTIVGVTL